jgi:hypothetical protein
LNRPINGIVTPGLERIQDVKTLAYLAAPVAYGLHSFAPFLLMASASPWTVSCFGRRITEDVEWNLEYEIRCGDDDCDVGGVVGGR